MPLLRFLLVFVSTIFIVLSARAETVLTYDVNGSSGWYPYYIADSVQHPGILAELVPQIFMLAHIELRKENLSPRRTNKALEAGLLDFDIVSPSWFESSDFGPQFVKSDPIIAITEHIVVLAGQQSAWQDIRKIYGQEIGTVRGYLYHDDGLFTRIDFKSERELIMALQKGRIEAAISADLTALYWAKQLQVSVELAAVHSDGVLVVRLRKEHQALLPSINRAIGQLKDNGTIDAIVNKYTVLEPAGLQ